ncbi:MAG: hypothetical protein E6I80_17460 [Chloroflexi bacterium]|nr:MAG: hypothetical protein E6I80_17460 [Chloroflexota bacterium]
MIILYHKCIKKSICNPSLQQSWRARWPDPTALPRLTARVNPTIHVVMLRIVRADDGWSDIVGLTLAVNLEGCGQP